MEIGASLNIPKGPVETCEVQVWYVNFDSAPNPEGPYYEQILGIDELSLGAKSVAQRRRELFCMRAALRLILSDLFPYRHPTSWKFNKNQFGKPSIDDKDVEIGFNLSHSAGMGIIALSKIHEIGVDIEKKLPHLDFMNIAKSHFAPDELVDLSSLNSEIMHSRFFEYWTLKEAFIKALGAGLSIPLDKFSFKFPQSSAELRMPRAAEIDIDNVLAWAKGHWSFTMLEPSADYQVAIAARMTQGKTLKLINHGLFSDWKRTYQDVA